MKIRNPHLKGIETSTAWGPISFDAEGCAEVSDEAGEGLLTVPNFVRCIDCNCGEEPAVLTETSKTPVVEIASSRPRKKKNSS